MTYHKGGKRALDICIAGSLLIICLPLLLVTALAVALTSRGPALFTQERVGLDGRLFRFFKFRSMYLEQGALVDIAKINADKSNGLLYKTRNDPRVTPVGRILRSTSIDELPQLWNVLLGEMSMVGPRPLVTHMLEPYPEIAHWRSSVRPGLTGLWQISNRGNNQSVQDMEAYDLDYVQQVSFRLDLKIMIRTPMKLTDGAF